MFIRATLKALSSPATAPKSPALLTWLPLSTFASMSKFAEKMNARHNKKSYINVESTNEESSQNQSEKAQAETFIPPNFSVRHLLWPETGSSILLLGIDRRDSMHGSFLHDILSRSTADLVSVQLSPDEPFFIRSSGDYKEAWTRFIRGKFDSRFFVSPNPRYLADILLDQEKIRAFMEGPIQETPSEFEVGSMFIYSKAGRMKREQVADNFLSPFLYSYNNPERRINIVVNDVPVLTQREVLSRVLSQEQLKGLLKQYLEALSEDNGHNFDPRILIPEAFIYPRIAYLTETLRQSCHVSKSIIALMDYNFIDLVEDAWVKLEPEMRSLQSCLQTPLPENDDLTYTDYVERHVLLDLIQEPFLKENFVDHKSFPLSGKDTVGMEMAKPNIFLIWDYHRRRYANKIKDKTPATFNDLRSGAGSKFEADEEMMQKIMGGGQEDFVKETVEEEVTVKRRSGNRKRE